MKRFVLIAVALMLMLSATVAYATDPVLIGHGYYDDGTIVPFTFTDVTTARDTARATKTDSEQRWYITLKDETNVSSSNILGARPRTSTGSNGMVADYKTFTHKVTRASFSYYSGRVSEDSSVSLRVKKDSEPTTSAMLMAAGRFCP